MSHPGSRLTRLWKINASKVADTTTTGMHGNNAPNKRSGNAPLIFVKRSVSFEVDAGFSISVTVTLLVLPNCFAAGDVGEEDAVIVVAVRSNRREIVT